MQPLDEMEIGPKSFFACLGWGTLVWRPEGLPLRGTWSIDGPHLPIEFARQSSEGHITLVIVDDSPLTTVLWSELTVISLGAAVSALAEREKTPAKGGARELDIQAIRKRLK